MRIGIDISQLAYQNTGVSNYLEKFLKNLFKEDKKNEYILFFASLRGDLNSDFSEFPNVSVKKFPIPPSALDTMWNKLHLMPIENFLGDLDIFISSDWTEPPTKKAKKITILYDLIVYKYPEETDKKIVDVQKRKLKWVKKETERIICISEATKNDAKEILGIEDSKLTVLYPGF
jgi:hypothetical protein